MRSFQARVVVINLGLYSALALKKICPKRLGVVQSAKLLTTNISALVLPLGRFEKGRCALGQVRGPISIIDQLYCPAAKEQNCFTSSVVK